MLADVPNQLYNFLKGVKLYRAKLGLNRSFIAQESRCRCVYGPLFNRQPVCIICSFVVNRHNKFLIYQQRAHSSLVKTL